MNHAMVGRLILKDWHLNRLALSASVAGGVVALGLIFRGGEVAGVLGLSFAFVVLILAGILAPMWSIVLERKNKSLAFVMSLPISAMEYTTAKVVANASMYVVVWLGIVASVLWTLSAGGYDGWIPIGILVSLAPMAAFFLLVAVALVTESEGWSILVMGACNVSYSFAWYLLIRLPQVRADATSGTPVWSDLIVSIIAVELGVIVLSLVLTFYLQSRKTDFI
jgi:hypothetical protein